jgi:serine protease Do
MAETKLQISRRAAIALFVIVLFVGAAVTTVLLNLAGHPVLAAEPRRVPVYVARSEPDAAPTARSVDGPTAMGFAAVVKPVLPAVVNISSSKTVRTQNSGSPFFNDPFFRQFFGNQFQVPRERREESLGSGVIVSPEGYILTNNHVIDGATDIKVFLPDKREFKGRVIGRDPKTDIAIVKIDATGLPAVTLGDSSKLHIGDYVLAIGDPFGIGETVTNGIVSATGRNGLDIENYEDFIQTDAPINPGNSGGALINARGELVGINTALISAGGGGNEGVGLAIPVNLARYVMDHVLKNGEVVRGWLGVSVQPVTPEIAKAFGVSQPQGALVGDVESKGPAAGAGFERGDVIVALNGQPVTGPNELRLRVSEMAPGTVGHLKVMRNGQPHDLSVKLGELPGSSRERASSQPGTAAGPLAGVQVEHLTPEVAQELKLPVATKGVVVDSVQRGSSAADAGLRRGDVIEEVNRKPVTNVSEYDQDVQKAGKQPVLLLVDRAGTTTFVVVGAAS